MKSLEWALIQYDRCPYKRGDLEQTCTQGKHLQMKAVVQVKLLQTNACFRLAAKHQKLEERLREESSSQPLEGTNLADILISDFYPPEVQDNLFLLFRPLSLWYFVIVVLKN